MSLAMVSPGTASPLGQSAVASLLDTIAERLPGVPVYGGVIDAERPGAERAFVARPATAPTVIVPLVLSAAEPAHLELAKAVADTAEPTALAGPLGPDRRLVDLLIARLLSLGLRASDRIVLACAASDDDRLTVDCHEMGRMLAASLGIQVRVGFISTSAGSTATPSLTDAVAMEREAAPCSRIVVSTYLLAPGGLADLVAASRADLVSPPLLLAHGEPDAGFVGIVLERYRAASERLESSSAASGPGVPLGLA